MPAHLQALSALLAHQAGVLVRVHQVQGSGPREVGAWMAVFADALVNTIGGGHLEWQATRKARELLLSGARSSGANEPTLHLERYPLGPALGQCCGGVVQLSYEVIGPADLARLHTALMPALHPLALFGGGHVGRALVQVLAPLPFAVHWVDSRDEIFPDQLPANVRCEHSDPVQAAVHDLSPGSAVLIMSFSHAEDLDVLAAALLRQRERHDLPFIGLIGSKSKWASFKHRLESRGFGQGEWGQVHCPIGVSGITGKAPEVVAVAIAAQLLQHCA